MNEKFELSCFQIITYVGTARTHSVSYTHLDVYKRQDEEQEALNMAKEANMPAEK